MNKDLIHSRFAKTLSSYDENGCGTGFLTDILSNNTAWKSYTALDIVGECRDYISQINPEIEFVEADIEDYLKNSSEKFDLIISNAALQWVNDFETTVRTLKNMLNPDGHLLFSTFGKENFREIYSLLGTGLDYYSPKEIEDLFKDLDIKTEEEIHVMGFKTPKEVLKHLKLTGVNAIENTSWTKSDLAKFEKGYSNLCPVRPTLTYNPIYIKISSN